MDEVLGVFIGNEGDRGMIVMGDLGGFGRRFWGAGVPWDGILWRIGVEEVDCLVVSGGINFVISE